MARHGDATSAYGFTASRRCKAGPATLDRCFNLNAYARAMTTATREISSIETEKETSEFLRCGFVRNQNFLVSSPKRRGVFLTKLHLA